MLYFMITAKCPFCECPCPWSVAVEVEPPPDALIKVVSPMHGGPFRIPFQNFKLVSSLPPDAPTEECPPPPPAPKPRWWQFWRR